MFFKCFSASEKGTFDFGFAAFEKGGDFFYGVGIKISANEDIPVFFRKGRKKAIDAFGKFIFIEFIFGRKFFRNTFVKFRKGKGKFGIAALFCVFFSKNIYGKSPCDFSEKA